VRYTLKQMMVFDAIAECSSVSKAADSLSLTQSATSMSLSQLENILGRPLFERQGKKMSLTYWGSWLRPRAKRLLQDARQIETGFSDQQSLSGDVSLCASQTPAEHLIPQLVSRIDHLFPQIRINVSVKSSNMVIEDVLNYRYDLGVIEGRCDDHRIRQEVWCHDYLVIVAAPGHAYADLPLVNFDLLANAQWVLREFGSGTRMVFDSAIQPFISHLNVWREYDLVPVLCYLTMNGDYLTCLPYLEVKPLLEAGQLVALNVPMLNMDRTMSFIWRTSMDDHPLIHCLRKEGSHLVTERNIINDSLHP
jgi:DNA-binding transcriptional LysR family regulator